MALVVSRVPERLALGVVWGLALAHGLVDAIVAIMVGPWSAQHTTVEGTLQKILPPRPNL